MQSSACKLLPPLLLLLLFAGCGDAYLNLFVSQSQVKKLLAMTDNATLKEINDNWEEIAPFLLDYKYTIPKEDHASLARKIRTHYFGGKPINRENLLILTHLVGDRLFVVDAENAARAQAKANKSPVWFYYYSYRASHSKKDLGVGHTDDVYLVLDTPNVDPTKSSADMAMQKDLIQLWVSHAHDGKPNIGTQWPRLNPYNENLNYLHLFKPQKHKLEDNINLSHRKFWNSIDFDEN